MCTIYIILCVIPIWIIVEKNRSCWLQNQKPDNVIPTTYIYKTSSTQRRMLSYTSTSNINRLRIEEIGALLAASNKKRWAKCLVFFILTSWSVPTPARCSGSCRASWKMWFPKLLKLLNKIFHFNMLTIIVLQWWDHNMLLGQGSSPQTFDCEICQKARCLVCWHTLQEQ